MGVFAAVLLILFYFRIGIFSGLTSFSHTVFRPVFIFGSNVGEKFGNFSSYFISKNYLHRENENLKSKLNESEARMSNYNSLLEENLGLKEILGRKVEQVMVLSAILSKPNQSLYDTLIIDAGLKQNLKVGDVVFALGNVPIGTIAETYSNSSKVVLFSNSREKTQGIISGKGDSNSESADGNIFVEIVGRGGGNFEMVVPLDFTLTKGYQVVLPGINPYVVGVVETVISDPRDPFIKAILVSPVNIQELKFVQVETQQ